MTVGSQLVDRLASVLRLDPEAWREDPYFNDIALEFAAGNESAFLGSGLDDNAIAELRQQAARISGHSPDHDEGAAHHRASKSSGAPAGTDTGEAVARTDRHVARNIAVEASGGGARAPIDYADASHSASDTTSLTRDENANHPDACNGAHQDEYHRTDDGRDHKADLPGDYASLPAVDITVRVAQSLEDDPTGKQLLEDVATLDAVAHACAFSKQKYSLILLTLRARKVAPIIEPAVKERAAVLRDAARDRERQRKHEDKTESRQRQADERRKQDEEKTERGRQVTEHHAGGPQYGADADGLFRVRKDHDGNLVRQGLANFRAQLSSTLAYRGDPAERVAYEIEWRLGERAGQCTVAADEFDELRWIAVKLPSDAIVYPKASTEVACAIRSISGPIPTRIVHQTTGWTEHHGGLVYCHGDGAIGGAGRVDDIHVELRPELKRFALPDPPRGPERAAAMRSLLAILDVAPLRVSLPLFAAVARAPIGDVRNVIWLAGGSGQMKSSISALPQSCCGPSMWSDDALPFGFDWTANAIEACLFVLKDSIVVIDDFAPDGGRREADQRNAAASRLVRSTANQRGRGRMMREGGGTYELRPRALAIFTGEDAPTGFSIAARMLRVEVQKGDVVIEKLTAAQDLAKLGAFASGYAAYIASLAEDLKGAQSDHHQRAMKARAALQQVAPHARTGALLGDLMAGLEIWLLHALRMGAITRSEAVEFQRRWRAEVEDIARTQASHVAAENPVRVFFRALLAGVGAARMHLTDEVGNRPPHAERWGWVRDRDDYFARGDRVGFVEDDFIFWEPEASYTATARYLQDSGQNLPIRGASRYGRELVAAKLVAERGDERGTVRRTIAGTRGSYWKISIEVLDEYVLGKAGTDGTATAQDAFDDRASQDHPQGCDASAEAAFGSVATGAKTRPDREPGDDDPDEVGWRGGHR